MIQPRNLADLNVIFASKPPEELLQWAVNEFGSNLTLACSLGAEDMVLVDMITKVDPQARIFVFDTGRLHEETYATMERARERYNIEFESYFPNTSSAENLVRSKGPVSFYKSVENRKECCFIRKVEPLNRALSNVDAWITGLRRAQSVTRTSLEKLEIDLDHSGIIKLNPLADWSEEQVWEYLRSNEVPWNPLHDKGFPSIGCAPCTRAVSPGEDLRAGRWWWENPEQKECGLHVRQKH